MADLKISQLNELAGANLATADLVAVVDDSASETKKLTVTNLITNGISLIANDAIPGAKILFEAGGIATADIADAAVTAAKLGNDAVTAAKLANSSIATLAATLPSSGDFTGQLALDTDDNSLYMWSGSAWLSIKAPASVNAFTDTTAGLINITTTVATGTATITATIDDTDAANKFLAGPTGAGGSISARVIAGSDLPVATASAKGGVIVNGEGLRMDTNTIEVDNDVTASTAHFVVTYNAKGLITGGRALTSADLPVATSSAAGAVIPGTGLSVDGSGNLNHTNVVTAGTFEKVTIDAQGHVTVGADLEAADIPAIDASKITSGTFTSARLATGAVTAEKLADSSVAKFGGAGATDNIVVFPAADFKGQFFFDEKNEDLYIHTGNSFRPITVISGNLILAGTYNASTNQLATITTQGSAAGFSVGAALPAPAASNLNYYVVVSESGTGSGAAPAVQLAPPDMLISMGSGGTYSLSDVSNAIAGQIAANIAFTPFGGLNSTDVQAAIQELDTEKLRLDGGLMTGNLQLATNVSLVFEGSVDDEFETAFTIVNPTADRSVQLPDLSGTVALTSQLDDGSY